MNKATATLSLGSTGLEKDFVLLVQIKDIGIPNAILETHPSISNHRAIMATLVPRFSLPPSRPEIVFVADRSGSMRGNILVLVSAMNVFLKSMPTGVKFNICSFGSAHSFLWPKSKSYTKETLEQATKHLDSFSADMGGTETFEAIKATVDRRFLDLPLEIMLLTDGNVWQQEKLFSYVNQQVGTTKGNIRVFPLGIGNAVSSSLIEGLARAGNGFAQTVQSGDRLDNAVVRMLRGALSPHITDATIEVKYEQPDSEFEIVDRAVDGNKVLPSESDGSLMSRMPSQEKPVISLFDPVAEPEKVDPKDSADSQLLLPEVSTPDILQAPHKIPSLFAFSRTSVYLLMSPETIQRNPIAVVLRATSINGPLELEIPIKALSAPAETIHQLAAKKAVQDIEEGRGWVCDAKDRHDLLLKDKYPSAYEDFVKKEAVRLGEMFQIVGKWCSFVAVAANDKEITAMEEESKELEAGWEFLDSHVGLAGSSYIQSPRGTGTRSVAFRTRRRSAFVTGTSDTVGAKKTLPPGTNLLEDLPIASGDVHRRTTDPLASFCGPSSISFGNDATKDVPSDSMVMGSLSQQISPRRSGGQRDAHQSGTDTEAQAAKTMPLTAGIEVKPLQVSATGWKLPRTGAIQVATGAAGPIPGTSSALDQKDLEMVGRVLNAAPSKVDALNFGKEDSVNLAKAPSPPPSATAADPMAMVSSSPAVRSQNNDSSESSPTLSELVNKSCTSSRYNPVLNSQARKMGSNGSRIGNTGQSLLRSSSSSDYREEKKETSLTAPTKVNWTAASTAEKVLALIKLQDFEGYWPDAEACGQIVGFETSKILGDSRGVDANVWVTLLMVNFLEKKCAEEGGTWDLVVEKAKAWLEALKRIDLEILEKNASATLGL